MFIAIMSCSLPHRGFVLPYCGVYCGTVVFIAMLWCSLPYCGVPCHYVVFTAILWCSLPYCDVHCRTAVFIAIRWFGAVVFRTRLSSAWTSQDSATPGKKRDNGTASTTASSTSTTMQRYVASLRFVS